MADAIATSLTLAVSAAIMYACRRTGGGRPPAIPYRRRVVFAPQTSEKDLEDARVSSIEVHVPDTATCIFMEGGITQDLEFCNADGDVVPRSVATHTRFGLNIAPSVDNPPLLEPVNKDSTPRFVSCMFLTTSSLRMTDNRSMSHAWCITADTRERIAYVIDSKYERDAEDEWRRLIQEPLVRDAIANCCEGWRVCDLTRTAAQQRPLCTLWVTLLNAAVIGGAVTPETDVFSHINDDTVLRIMGLVNNDVHRAEAVETVSSALNRLWS
jgi:hypothetical protein